MNTYSMRAECSSDVEKFVTRSRQACHEITHATIHRMRVSRTTLPDITFEFDSDATLGQLQQVLAGIVDSHVMVETLRACPLSENSLERNYGAS